MQGLCLDDKQPLECLNDRTLKGTVVLTVKVAKGNVLNRGECLNGSVGMKNNSNNGQSVLNAIVASLALSCDTQAPTCGQILRIEYSLSWISLPSGCLVSTIWRRLSHCGSGDSVIGPGALGGPAD